MNKRALLKEMVSLADYLDNVGMVKEAKMLDRIMTKVAQDPDPAAAAIQAAGTQRQKELRTTYGLPTSIAINVSKLGGLSPADYTKLTTLLKTNKDNYNTLTNTDKIDAMPEDTPEQKTAKEAAQKVADDALDGQTATYTQQQTAACANIV